VITPCRSGQRVLERLLITQGKTMKQSTGLDLSLANYNFRPLLEVNTGEAEEIGK
jgi:hypothetical protein